MNQPFLQHLKELRLRLTWVVCIVLLGTAGALFFAEQLYGILKAPLTPVLPENSSFIALGLMEAWSVYFKVALVTGIVFTAPLWFYQVWIFLAPGLHKKEKRLITFASFATSLCFLVGVSFCYFVIMPFGFEFLISLLQGSSVTIMPQMNLYLSFALRLIIAFGVVFQLPVIITLLVRWNIVELATFKKLRRHMIVFAFVIAAILTPPDFITQTMMAIPFIILFEIGLLFAKIGKKKSGPQ